ncbi:hypothetical protein P3X46_013777 [Hevea brasiliensis]|uniref:F-box domain-containing protein n=1 Tax=Hevea brasiliensis TaxID=3981 RepID=A0ABQ9M4N3_HEVBR|nr:F-box/LRR-repeat protein At1g55660-like [Hevea brasiliensis]KAJ9175199.1 hypothetical protein P3X46_013777 [Hevea brasiliensis]
MVLTSESTQCTPWKWKQISFTIPVQKKRSSLCKLKHVVGKSDFQPVSGISDRKNDRKIKKLPLEKDCLSVKDCISELPDDILIAILSHLKLREAVRTSVLSKRWRYLWTFSQGILEFDASDVRSLLDSVYYFLTSHRAPTIEELSIRFPGWGNVYYHYSPCKIHVWINVAIEKRVKKLVLDFINPHLYPSGQFDSLGSVSFTSLVSLHLIRARVSSQLINFFLSNSPLLEVLCVEWTRREPGHLKVCASSLTLKHLDLRHNEIGFLEISAPNLESFRFRTHGEKTSLVFKDVPRLSHASFGGCYGDSLIAQNLLRHSSLFAQLKSLELLLPAKPTLPEYFPHFPTLENLKHMQLSLSKQTDEGFRIFFCLMGASPSLHRSSLKLGSCSVQKLTYTKSLEFTSRPKHQCLKVVEIVGFREDDNHDELVMHLAEYAALLEKIIIDPYQCSEVSRNRARNLQSKLPPSVKLEIF